ncbi:hypothetical protein MMC09_002871 [Bachmanniomyces sp. S44760]|nr:hypothetical protein [Bachmanniomyces sp. S44760]
MSFLNSVLGSIGSEGAQPVAPIAKPPNIRASRVEAAVARFEPVRKDSLPPNKGAPPSLKRKAEEDLPRQNDKFQKKELAKPLLSNGSIPPNKPTARPPISEMQSTPSTSSISQPCRGTNKPTPSRQPSIPAVSESKAPPKKGSYAEIMARAKASHQTAAPVGVIKHKPKEKLSSKKELMLRKKGLLPNGKPVPKSIEQSKHRSATPAFGDEPKSSQNDRRPSQTGYQGTAKPKVQPSYKGTMKANPSIRKDTLAKDKDRPFSRSRSTSANPAGPRYRYTEESEDGLEEDDDDDAGDDAESDLSDMEAGFSDVEEEDQRALKEAKKEDEFEARMEVELKRQKEERKKRLIAMAKKHGKH